MLTPNVKVVSVLPGWWRIVALFGAAAGLLFVIRELDQIASRSELGALLALLSVPVLIPGALVSLSFSEQRLGRSCFEAVAVGTGLTVGFCAWLLWFAGAGATDPVSVALVAARVELVSVPLCLVIRLVGLWFVRSFIRRLVVAQPGNLCRTCGYDLTGNESGVCPECGTEIEQEREGR